MKKLILVIVFLLLSFEAAFAEKQDVYRIWKLNSKDKGWIGVATAEKTVEQGWLITYSRLWKLNLDAYPEPQSSIFIGAAYCFKPTVGVADLTAVYVSHIRQCKDNEDNCDELPIREGIVHLAKLVDQDFADEVSRQLCKVILPQIKTGKYDKGTLKLSKDAFFWYRKVDLSGK